MGRRGPNLGLWAHFSLLMPDPWSAVPQPGEAAMPEGWPLPLPPGVVLGLPGQTAGGDSDVVLGALVQGPCKAICSHRRLHPTSPPIPCPVPAGRLRLTMMQLGLLMDHRLTRQSSPPVASSRPEPLPSTSEDTLLAWATISSTRERAKGEGSQGA